MKKKKIIISGGGTGGHVFPAIEIAKSIKIIRPSVEILFVGASNKMEMHQVPKQGFPILGLWIQGFYRHSILKNILLPIKLLVSLAQSIAILMYHQPFAVIGTGGFASGPVLFTASLLGFKTYIQEQNFFPGLTSKLLSKKVNKIFVSYDGMQRFFPKDKIIKLGNPVRQSLKTKFSTKSKLFFGLQRHKFTLLVIGGSLGAEPINKAFKKHLKILTQNDIQIIWQTGKNDYKKYSQLNSDFCSVNPFIDRMDLAYSASDLVISRAGAIAIAEISFLSKASILIPSPHVADNHQLANARYLKKNDACMLVLEKDLMTQDLPNKIKQLTCHHSRKKIGQNANRLFDYNAANNIANIILKDSKC